MSKNKTCTIGCCKADDHSADVARQALEAQLWWGDLPPTAIADDPKVFRIALWRDEGAKLPRRVGELLRQLEHRELLSRIGTLVAYAEIRALEDEAAFVATFGNVQIENHEVLCRALEEKRPIFYFSCGASSRKAHNTVFLPVLRTVHNQFGPKAVLVAPLISPIDRDVYVDDAWKVGDGQGLGTNRFGVYSELSLRHSSLSLERRVHETEERPDYDRTLRDYFFQFSL